MIILSPNEKMFITEFSLKLDPPQSSLRPWHGQWGRSAPTGAEQEKESLLFRDNQMIHSELLLRRAESLQPASHPRAPTIEVVGSVPVRSWLRGMNHQLTAKSIFASKADEAVRGATSRRKQPNNLTKIVACRGHRGRRFFQGRLVSKYT